MQLAIRKDTVLVSACGRSVALDVTATPTMMFLQNQLQAHLHMDGQTFQFFDVNGTQICTDNDLRDTIAKDQTPLCATLTDASIHYIENRREELAQMQWKLIRDQVSGSMAKHAEVTRQVAELAEALSIQKKEAEAACRAAQRCLSASCKGKECSGGDHRRRGEASARGAGRLGSRPVCSAQGVHHHVLHA
jgi:hypothetical protein